MENRNKVQFYKIIRVIKNYPGGKFNITAVRKINYLLSLTEIPDKSIKDKVTDLKKLIKIYYSEKKIESAGVEEMKIFLIALCDEIIELL